MNRDIRGLLSILVIGVMASLLCGCYWEERIVYDGWAEFEKSMQGNTRTQVADSGGLRQTEYARSSSYGIMMKAFGGPTRAEEASRVIEQLRQKVDIHDLWIKEYGGALQLFYGSYKADGMVEGNVNLERIQNISLDGGKPFEKAHPFQMSGANQVAQDVYDAATYRGYYTVQIAFYTPDFGKDHREAAEKAVQILRKEGELAFYYHGPISSHVCVGLFTKEDRPMVAQENFMVESDGKRIVDMKRKYPYQLCNGVTMIKKDKMGHKIGEIGSKLIKLP